MDNAVCQNLRTYLLQRHIMSSSNSELPRATPSPRHSRRVRLDTEIAESGKTPVTKEEIDTLIANWYEAKLRLKQADTEERRLKRLIHQLLDLTQSSGIEGRDLVVTRYTQKRRFLSKAVVPAEIWDRYAQEQSIQMLRVSARSAR